MVKTIPRSLAVASFWVTGLECVSEFCQQNFWAPYTVGERVQGAGHAKFTKGEAYDFYTNDSMPEPIFV